MCRRKDTAWIVISKDNQSVVCLGCGDLGWLWKPNKAATFPFLFYDYSMATRVEGLVGGRVVKWVGARYRALCYEE